MAAVGVALIGVGALLMYAAWKGDLTPITTAKSQLAATTTTTPAGS